jgi:ectoine hydroxylase-related dioxygenase (phytanoyl-CoA dioxygenase family)
MTAVSTKSGPSPITEHFRDNGFVVVRGLFSTSEVNELRSAFMQTNENGPVHGLSEINKSYNSSDPLSFYPRMMHPHRHPDKGVGLISKQWMLDARIHNILTDLFDDEPIAAQSMFYFKPPGARGQDLHQDNFYLRVYPGTCIAAWVAIDAADEENGTLIVVPGSHVLPIACPEKADPSRFFTSDHVAVPEGMHTDPVLLQAGDVLFFNGSLIHGSYENSSAHRFRRAFICHYVPASCIEVSSGYRPLLTFNGEEVDKQGASGGGPCGVPHEELAPH